MRHLMLVQILLLTSIAFAQENPTSCAVSKSSTLSLSSAGTPQVSNLAFIEITCTVPARPIPNKPGEGRNGLNAATTAYEVSPDSMRKEVPSNVIVSGGGQKQEKESVFFTLYLPLDRAGRNREARRYFDRLLKGLNSPDTDSQLKMATHFLRKQMLSQRKQYLGSISNDISQHRTGHFEVQCRVLDGTRVIGVGVVQLEVLFKGRFSDSLGLPGYWQTANSPKK